MKRFKDFRMLNSDRRFVILWAAFAGIVVFIQSYRWVAVGDYSYMVEYAYKLYSGSIPFKDFMTPYPPGTFYIMSALIELFGLNNFVFKIYVVFLQILIVIISYIILQKISRSHSLNRILVLPLAFVGQAMFPFPVYDIHAHILVLAAIMLFISIMNDEKQSSAKLFLFGVSTTLPIFFKQNVGVSLIVAIYGSPDRDAVH